MYEHLRILLQEFKYTVYSHFLLTNEKLDVVEIPNILQEIRINDYTKNFPTDNLKNISIKNIYNFAKSISRYQSGKEYLAYPKQWKSLEPEEKKIILERLNGTSDIMSWFNISRYIKYIHSELGFKVTNLENYHQDLFAIMKDNILTHMLFISLIVKGMLIKFIPNKKLTDTKYVPVRKDVKKSYDMSIFGKSTENPMFSRSYSYLSERPYTDYGRVGEANSNIGEGGKGGWFSMYALDWVSQLGFCHKFIHQRVQYITGGTGVGKSTQVPKLFMYYLKALGYNSSGKVACTQPRKAPTSSNAKNVSMELGFPIVYKIDKDKPEISTHDFYVQMHHKEDKHVQDTPHLSLKYITDGTLVQEIKELTPLFKRIKPNGDSEDRNLYDVVIIDEAHEHGKNMDVLLTMLKTYTYYNPEIKLVILSATMDDDEPTYRRYYRDINDNKRSPIDTRIRDLGLDRINIDRRFHISPPGYGTNFPIEEIYRPQGDVYDTVREIIKDGMKGSILIFQPGEADIVKMVQELNKFLPDDVLALPFYSSLDKDKKELIENIDSKYKEIRMAKTDDFKTVKDPTTGSASYNHFVICATNIAEASITIAKLFYVIETGTRKSNIYDYKNRISQLKLLPISESSRLQRKGRVGRTGPGKVYYLYKKGAMENNKILFEFSTNNIADDIFVYLSRPNKDLITIDRILTDKQIKEQFGYLFNTSRGPYTYYGVDSHSDYQFSNKYQPQLYESGYDSYSLYDYAGEFYIIHPDELEFDRNILGTIVVTNNPLLELKDGKLKSPKIQSFFDDLELLKFIVQLNDQYYSTDFGQFYFKLINKFQFDNQYLNKLLANAILLDNIDNGARIVAMMNAISGAGSFDYTNILDPEIKIIPPENYQLKMYDLDYFKRLFPNSNSDVDTLLLYVKEIINYLNKKVILSDFREVDQILITQKKMSQTEYLDIVYNFNQSSVDRDKLILERIQLKCVDPELIKHVKQFASIIKVDYKHIINFIENYMLILDTINSCFYPDKRGISMESDINLYQEEFKKFKSYNPNYTQFLITQPFNIAKRIDTTERFMNIYMPGSENIFSLPTYRQKVKDKSSLKVAIGFDSFKATNYVLYFNIDTMRDAITVVIPIDKSYLKLYDNIYNKLRLVKFSDKFKKIDKYVKKIEDPKVPKPVINGDIDALVRVKTTYDKLLLDLN